MKKNFKVTENTVGFNIDISVYPISAILKTAYIFIDRYYVFLFMEGPDLLVELKCKEGQINENIVIGEFYNELLNQLLRLHIYQDTKNIRELILARALHQTCIETESLENIEPVSSGIFDINDIANDWFAIHEEV